MHLYQLLIDLICSWVLPSHALHAAPTAQLCRLGFDYRTSSELTCICGRCCYLLILYSINYKPMHGVLCALMIMITIAFISPGLPSTSFDCAFRPNLPVQTRLHLSRFVHCVEAASRFMKLASSATQAHT